MGKITIITGEIQSGKTSLCLEIAEIAGKSGFKLGGLLSPAVFQGGKKIAIDALDLKSGERVRLADAATQRPGGLSTRRWGFLPEGVTWGNQILEHAVPCDLLMVDELGPLEFNRAEGWVSGFAAVESGEYQAALVVIRPSLVPEAVNRWNVDRVIQLDDPDQASPTGAEILASLPLQV